MNFPDVGVIPSAVHESENVYPDNLGNTATVTSAPYLYDAVPGNAGASDIAGSFVYA